MTHFFMAVEGVIGVGKTTLARLLQPVFDAELVLEIVEENPFLSDFYQDHAQYAFQTQIFFLLSRFRQMQVSLPEMLTRTNVISDYILAKDRIFAQLTLTADELDMHRRLFPILAARLPQPDLVVYLHASTDALMERIAQRDRPFERSMSRQYIDDLRVAYDQVFASYRDAQLLTIETDSLNVVRRPEHLGQIAERIRAALNIGEFQLNFRF
jgi:deoxyguanosine kinase